MNIKNEERLLISITDCLIHNNQFKHDGFDPSIIECHELLYKSLRHGLFPLVYKTLYPIIPIKFQAMFDQYYYEFEKMTNLYIKELKRIADIAEQNNIKIILLKGLSLSNIIYGDLFARAFSDLDILVNENDMVTMYNLMNKIGYVQTGTTRNKIITINTTKFRNSPLFHEYQCIKRIGKSDYLHIEIKRASSAIPQKHIHDFLNNTQLLHVADINILATNITYTFFHLCANFYNDNESYYGAICSYRLRDLVDIAVFIRKYKTELNWEYIYTLSTKYEITHEIYFVINNIIDVYNYPLLEKEIVELFKPVNLPYEYFNNPDGSYFKWKTDYLTRLFDDELRKREARLLFKEMIYNDKNYNNYIETANNDYEVIFNINSYKMFYIKKFDCNINYLFTRNTDGIQFNVLIDSCFYENMNGYNLGLYFMDNDPANGENISILIKLASQLVVLFKNINECQWQHIKCNDKVFIQIAIPINLLNMDLTVSKNFINFYLEFSETFSDDLETVYERLSNSYIFLKMS